MNVHFRVSFPTSCLVIYYNPICPIPSMLDISEKQMFPSGLRLAGAGVPSAGTYDIAIKGYCWLQQVIPNVVVAGNVSGLTATLINADLNNDNSVYIFDR